MKSEVRSPLPRVKATPLCAARVDALKESVMRSLQGPEPREALVQGSPYPAARARKSMVSHSLLRNVSRQDDVGGAARALAACPRMAPRRPCLVVLPRLP
jgi:hypothetical protein